MSSGSSDAAVLHKRESKSMAERELLILGTDEAGYGPNLGPLLVGASCWKAVVSDDEALVCDRSGAVNPGSLFDFAAPAEPSAQDAADAAANAALDNAFRGFPTNAEERLNAAVEPISGTRKAPFPLLDSKKLYGPSRSLAALERPFLLASKLLGRDSGTLAAILAGLNADPDPAAAGPDAPLPPPEAPLPPWETPETLRLAAPVDSKTLKRPLDDDLRTVTARLESERVSLLALGARRVQPLEFNMLLDRLGLKSDLIAEATTSLAAETLHAAQERAATAGTGAVPESGLVLCDKLGGRDRYSGILAARFPGAFVRIVREGRAASVYRLLAERCVDRYGRTLEYRKPLALEIRFTAKGESNAPTALASIVAKYLRELSMELFNNYWIAAASDRELAPTAGYPVDALRFRDDVADVRERLGVPDDVFWRRK